MILIGESGGLFTNVVQIVGIITNLGILTIAGKALKLYGDWGVMKYKVNRLDDEYCDRHGIPFTPVGRDY